MANMYEIKMKKYIFIFEQGIKRKTGAGLPNSCFSHLESSLSGLKKNQEIYVDADFRRDGWVATWNILQGDGQLRSHYWDFPGGAVVRDLPANAGDTVRALVQEDLTCHRAMKPVRHNY